MRTRTLSTTVLISTSGTIRGGSFLSSMLAIAPLRRWLVTAATLPSRYS